MEKVKIGCIRLFAAVIGLFAASASLWATDGTWLYREGVGASVTAPADWADPANWVDGNGSVNLAENGIAVLEFQKQRAQVRLQAH